jgi:hypothetical protein
MVQLPSPIKAGLPKGKFYGYGEASVDGGTLDFVREKGLYGCGCRQCHSLIPYNTIIEAGFPKGAIVRPLCSVYCDMLLPTYGLRSIN